jgi:hypothetical protein
MNYTKSILILLVLCLCIVPAIATSSDYTSKYVATNNLPYYQYGWLSGSIRCGVNDFTSQIGIRNDNVPNGTYDFYNIAPDGRFLDHNGNVGIALLPGGYSLYLPDGNGGHAEYSHADIVAGVYSFPEKDLLGHSVSPAPIIAPTATPTPEPTRKIIIIDAIYGAEWTTPGVCPMTFRSICKPVEHGTFVNIRPEIQKLVNNGHYTFKFDVATIADDSGNALAVIPSGDPVPGIVKYAVITYLDNHGLHQKWVMEQDYRNPYTDGSAQIPYHAPTTATTVTL